MRTGATTTHELIDGAWAPTNKPQGLTANPNFVIVCNYGDWSGFRTLAECLAQIPESWPRKSPGFFRIEER